MAIVSHNDVHNIHHGDGSGRTMLLYTVLILLTFFFAVCWLTMSAFDTAVPFIDYYGGQESEQVGH